MNVVHDIICIGFPRLCGTGSKQKIQNEKLWIHEDSNQQVEPFALQAGALDQGPS